MSESYLHEGEKDQSYKIHSLDGSHSMMSRLKEMGIREGEHIVLLKKGNPCIVKTKDCGKWAIDAKLVSKIKVYD